MDKVYSLTLKHIEYDNMKDAIGGALYCVRGWNQLPLRLLQKHWTRGPSGSRALSEKGSFLLGSLGGHSPGSDVSGDSDPSDVSGDELAKMCDAHWSDSDEDGLLSDRFAGVWA